MYAEEWAKFWQMRYDQLKKEGKVNPAEYDYIPEWKAFWTERMQQIHEKSVKSQKKKLRVQCGLSDEKCSSLRSRSRSRSLISISSLDTVSSSKFQFSSRAKQEKRRHSRKLSRKKHSPIRSRSRSLISVSSLDSIRSRESSDRHYESEREERRHSSKLSRKKRSPIKSRSRSPINSLECISSRESSLERSYQADRKRIYGPRNRSFDSHYSGGSRSRRSASVHEASNFDENEPVTLVSVCRILSALDHELGSLCSSVLDLLSRALAVEKVKPNSSDEALMTTENVLLLETVKEKMKGLVMLNILPAYKIAAVKKCIQNIAKLIHQNPVKQVEQAKAIDDPKVEISLQIAEHLKACGKDNCTPEELEVLVEMFFDEEASPEEIEPDLESLTDDDIKTLLSNFASLSESEQNSVIKLVAEIEKSEPDRIQKLRECVNSNVASSSDNSTGASKCIVIDDDSDDYDLGEVFKSNQQPKESAAAQRSVESLKSLSDNLLTLIFNSHK